MKNIGVLNGKVSKKFLGLHSRHSLRSFAFQKLIRLKFLISTPVHKWESMSWRVWEGKYICVYVYVSYIYDQAASYKKWCTVFDEIKMIHFPLLLQNNVRGTTYLKRTILKGNSQWLAYPLKMIIIISLHIFLSGKLGELVWYIPFFHGVYCFYTNLSNTTEIMGLHSLT